MKKHFLFISYSSKDIKFVKTLNNTLEYYDINLFLDLKDIKPGDSIPGKIYEGIDRSTSLILILSEHSVKSKWVEEEFHIAKMKERENKQYKIIPILIDNVKIPPFLTHIKYIDLKKWEVKEKYYSEISKILSTLNVKPNYLIKSEKIFLLNNFDVMIKAKEVADISRQLFFQLERAFFYVCGQNIGELKYYSGESINKSVDMDKLDDLLSRINDYIEANQKTIMLKSLKKESTVLKDYLTRFYPGYKIEYKDIWKAKDAADNLSTSIRTLLLEIANIVNI